MKEAYYLFFICSTSTRQSLLVVLTHSMANSNVAEWARQMLLVTVLDNPEKNDDLGIAKETVKRSLSSWPKMAD